jgi:hypothetical protein
MKRTVVQTVGLVVVGFVGAVALAEVGLRVWTPDILAYKAVRRADDLLHHSLIPSSRYIARNPDFSVEVRTNSMGFRDREHIQDPPRAFKIVVLGDSFVEGHGVPAESCFVSRLETKLKTEESIRGSVVVVFNFGIAGYSPLLEYLLLKHRGLPLKPDLVILCYDMSDVQEDVLYARDAEFDSSGAPLKVNPSWPSFGTVATLPRGMFKTYLQEYSYVYSVLAAFVNSVKPATTVKAGDIDASRYAHTVDSVAGSWQVFFDQSQLYVRMIHELCMSRGITFVLATHPRGHQVNRYEWADGRKYSGLDSSTPNSAIFRSLQVFAKGQSMPFLDMTLAFRAHSKGDLFFPYDGHWTSSGHAVAADTLYDFLARNRLIPGILPR